jgi:hypothetical protein
VPGLVPPGARELLRKTALVKPKHERAISSDPEPNASAGGPVQPLAGSRLVGIREAARLLSLSVASARRLVTDGHLPVVRLTRRLLIDVRDLERVIDRAKVRSHWTPL